jgi:hypothetical protein
MNHVVNNNHYTFIPYINPFSEKPQSEIYAKTYKLTEVLACIKGDGIFGQKKIWESRYKDEHQGFHSGYDYEKPMGFDFSEAITDGSRIYIMCYKKGQPFLRTIELEKD